MRSSKILYVSDLDGTLLRMDQTLSRFTVDTINSLVERGMIFSYATARSYVTARRVTQGLSSKIPVIVYNGSFIMENGTDHKLLANFFSASDAHRILDLLLAHKIYPIVYSYVDGVERFVYCPQHESPGMKVFQDTRRGDVRDFPVQSTDMLYQGEIFHFTCIDEAEKLYPLYQVLKDSFPCVYHVDIYSGEQWFEIHPARATKADSVLELKKMLNCDRVICFGDAKNDLSMFSLADECYAVANADPELKKMATAVIGSHEDDSVAKWLLEHYINE